MAVVPFPRPRRLSMPDLDRLAQLIRLVPTRGSLAIAAAIVALAGAAYLVARETPLFAVRSVEVSGARGPLAAQVRAALRPLQGTSLLALRGAAVQERIAGVPGVESATYDRAFPNTLRVTVVPERAVAVVRQGAAAWLLSASGRVLRALPRDGGRRLPRIWVPRSTDVQVGETMAPEDGARAAAALAVAREVGFRARVRDVSVADGELVFSLRSGLRLRLGDDQDLPLKLAVAARILPLLGAAAYLDVSVPARPVAGSASAAGPVQNPQPTTGG